MEPLTLRPAAMYDRVLANLRQDLMTGRAIPGQVMSLRKLAKAYGTSAMPVRKALAHLVAANALQELANRSVQVPLLTRAALRDLFEVRVLVETAAAKAAILNVCDLARRDLAARAEEVNADVVAGIMKRDVVAVLSSNKRFHFMIYEASGSDVLMPIIESLWLRIGPPMHAGLLTLGMSWVEPNHNGILKALHQMDADLVAEALSVDIRATAAILLQLPAFAEP